MSRHKKGTRTRKGGLIMCIIDVYLVPLLASYYGVVICTIGYCDSHKNLGMLVFLWICVIIATILYVLRRKAYKENKKA